VFGNLNDKQVYFELGSLVHVEKTADFYTKFSPEKYQKYTAADEWEKQSRHAERMKPLPEASMREERN
jgi:hypothetical protein